MAIVTISPEFQVLIPKGIREAPRLERGQKVEVLQYQNWIECIPVQPMKKMRGFLEGMETTNVREPDDA